MICIPLNECVERGRFEETEGVSSVLHVHCIPPPPPIVGTKTATLT